MNDLYSAFIVNCCTPKALYNHGGVSPQPPPVYQRSPHTSYRESYRVNQGDGDYWEAMMVRGQWREIVLDTRVTPLLFTRSPMGFLMTTESQDLGLTSHPKDGNLHISWHENIARTCPNRSSVLNHQTYSFLSRAFSSSLVNRLFSPIWENTGLKHGKSDTFYSW